MTSSPDNQPMLPDLQSSLLCDDVRQERNGKFMLIGLFDAIGAAHMPLRYPRLFIVTRWCSGEGIFHQFCRIVKPDGENLIQGKKVVTQLSGQEATATNVEVFVNVEFPDYGLYWVEILLDGNLKLRYPLRIYPLKVNPAQPAPPDHFGAG